MNNYSILVPSITVLLTFLGFLIAVRNELKKSHEKLLQARLIEEQRHSTHERRLQLIEQKFDFAEKNIRQSFDDIKHRITRLYDLFIKQSIEGR